MKVVIEKGIPAPAGYEERPNRWPLKSMEPGDSFSAPAEHLKSVQGAAASANKRYPGRRYTVRTVEGGVRCWRTE